jgi:hypothetical protein
LSFIQSLVYSKFFDLLCITETWLASDIADNEILPNGFTIYRRDRSSHGGGVLIAISNSLLSRLLEIALDVELIAIQILLPITTTVACIYIPPLSSVASITAIVNCINKLSSTSLNSIIMGDFNHPNIEWSSLSSNSNTGSMICDCFFYLNLIQLVDKPTHVKGNIFDIIATKNKQHVVANRQHLYTS